MTGFGEGRYQSERLSLTIELRAVNNRYLKLAVCASDPYHLLEAEFEKVVRRSVRRGTLQLNLRCERQSAAQDFRINPVALTSYVQQIRALAEQLGLPDSGESMLSQVLTLPGVVPEAGSLGSNLHDDWPIIEKVLQEALTQLNGMRKEDGRAMAQELLALRDNIRKHLNVIKLRVPHVASTFRDRLHERVRALLAELDVKLDRNDLVREVSIFADRSDISEEVVRLGAHLDHFEEVMKDAESPGASSSSSRKKCCARPTRLAPRPATSTFPARWSTSKAPLRKSASWCRMWNEGGLC